MFNFTLQSKLTVHCFIVFFFFNFGPHLSIYMCVCVCFFFFPFAIVTSFFPHVIQINPTFLVGWDYNPSY
jgi:hypothetical protein